MKFYPVSARSNGKICVCPSKKKGAGNFGPWPLCFVLHFHALFYAIDFAPHKGVYRAYKYSLKENIA